MNYEETGFRGFYHQLCVVHINDYLDEKVCNVPESDIANCVLTWGYFDTTGKFTLEIVSLALSKEEQTQYADPLKERVIIDPDQIKDAQFRILFDIDTFKMIYNSYKDKIESMPEEEPNAFIDRTREISVIDPFRDEEYLDIVEVYLTKEGREPEMCHVKLKVFDGVYLYGTLLDEPKQDFGTHKGYDVGFWVRKVDDGLRCVSNLDIVNIWRREALEDGKVFESVLQETAEVDEEHRYMDRNFVLLRDCELLVPYSIEKNENGEIRMVPKIEKIYGNYLLNAFSSEKIMKEYFKNQPAVRRSMMDIIALARNCEVEIDYILINHQLMAPSESWEMMERMESHLADEQE